MNEWSRRSRDARSIRSNPDMTETAKVGAVKTREDAIGTLDRIAVGARGGGAMSIRFQRGELKPVRAGDPGLKDVRARLGLEA